MSTENKLSLILNYFRTANRIEISETLYDEKVECTDIICVKDIYTLEVSISNNLTNILVKPLGARFIYKFIISNNSDIFTNIINPFIEGIYVGARISNENYIEKFNDIIGIKNIKNDR